MSDEIEIDANGVTFTMRPTELGVQLDVSTGSGTGRVVIGVLLARNVAEDVVDALNLTAGRCRRPEPSTITEAEYDRAMFGTPPFPGGRY